MNETSKTEMLADAIIKVADTFCAFVAANHHNIVGGVEGSRVLCDACSEAIDLATRAVTETVKDVRRRKL